MSYDIFVWLSCAVALPSALPEPHTWEYHRFTEEQVAGYPKEIAEELVGSESWGLKRTAFYLNVSRMDRKVMSRHRLQELVPGLQVMTIQAPLPPGDPGPTARDRELAARAKVGRAGISVVQEGFSDPGWAMQKTVARHLARACGGAIVETPDGYIELDANGRMVE
ncbi:hypothetical protein [Ramlibacter albus]|uniref:Uncharacterized protein n=1 Tax=Ramlibacter albus TaxID=2079448 RepID=A0A923ME64_9BURK|nr:hypothetical protein [Ramlibacter albus]MBC5768708.1 hypothetical protein [Ramlibacter albus]